LPQLASVKEPDTSPPPDRDSVATSGGTDSVGGLGSTLSLVLVRAGWGWSLRNWSDIRPTGGIAVRFRSAANDFVTSSGRYYTAIIATAQSRSRHCDCSIARHDDELDACRTSGDHGLGRDLDFVSCATTRDGPQSCERTVACGPEKGCGRSAIMTSELRERNRMSSSDPLS
jgi:hypothetical protein